MWKIRTARFPLLADSMPKLRALFALLTLLALSAGCYRYVPVQRSAAPSGAKVRASLTDAGQDEVRARFGPDAVSLEGTLVDWDEDGVAVSLQSYVRRQGFPPTSFTDTVHLLPRHFQGVEVQELDGWRTAGVVSLVAAASVVAAFAPRALGGQSESGEGGDEGDPQDPNAHILIRIPLGFSFFW
jgi:hypothetical protein